MVNKRKKTRKKSSERRGALTLRRIVQMFPDKIKFPLMRSQIRISENRDKCFSFCIGKTQEELAEAYRILQESYVDMGYSQAQISGMRIVKYFALPTTTTLIALYDGKVVGTGSVIRRGAFGLPMASAFDLSEYFARNEVISEISSLAIDAKFRQNR